MTYLLSISIGPVQSFIEAARRTADLTAGSELLVEIAKAVAKSITDTPGSKLIFPAQDEAGKITDGPNKILAEVQGDPSAIAENARQAAQAVLETEWGRTLQVTGTQHINVDLAEQQIASFLEFYAAWVPLGDDYVAARREVELLLAGRKALRDFGQPQSEAAVFKSPLDPARDSVLAGARPKRKASDPDPPYIGVAPLYLKKAEHLDAVSLIKRVLGRQTGHVQSTTQLAATALMADLDKKAPAETTALRNYAKGLPSGVREEDLLYPGRRDDAKAAGELVKDDQQDQPARAKDLAEAALKKAGYGIAPPDWASYYAILCADGDRMGKRLGEMTKAGEHVDFSKKLSGFAERAREIVAEHEGHCVYSGGDDVLALLPTHTALDCAAKLAAEFASTVGSSLSVGVAIVHHMEPLRVSLERAREAEREAKKKRNSLAVALHTRGGEPRVVAETWRSDFSLGEWNAWIQAFRGKEGLSHGFPYELRHLAREAKGVLDQETLRAEALRILERKEGGKEEPGQGPRPYLESVRSALSRISGPQDIEDLVAKLVICRFLAQYPEVK